MGLTQSPKKTSTITFRLDDDNIRKLRAESSTRQVSTNVLVNQALRRFIEWDIFGPVSGFVLINKKVFAKVFGNMTQKEIIDIANGIG